MFFIDAVKAEKTDNVINFYVKYWNGNQLKADKRTARSHVITI